MVRVLQSYESIVMRGWCEKVRSKNLRGSEGFVVGSTQAVVGKVKVRDWHFAGTERNAKIALDGATWAADW